MNRKVILPDIWRLKNGYRDSGQICGLMPDIRPDNELKIVNFFENQNDVQSKSKISGWISIKKSDIRMDTRN